MREVASSINEKKRKVENIKKIAEWQLGIEQWEVSTLLNNKPLCFWTKTKLYHFNINFNFVIPAE